MRVFYNCNSGVHANKVPKLDNPAKSLENCVGASKGCLVDTKLMI